jgi:hypothetical protein
MINKLKNFAKTKGLNILKVKETQKEITILFSPISKCNKMDKIGSFFRNEFKDKEIGWSSNSITVLK